MTTRTKLLAALFFFAPAAYSSPGRIYYALAGMSESSLVSGAQALLLPSILLSAAMLIVRSRERRAGARTALSGHCIGLALLVWFLSATLSCAANAHTEMVPLYYVAGFVSSLVTYWAVRDISMSHRDINIVLLALSVGSLFPLLAGLHAYYAAFGIPEFGTLLFSRYDTKRMLDYQQATFGNTGNTAAFLLLVGPTFLALALDRSRSRLLRLWFSICSCLIGIHLSIVQARASFLVLLLLGPILLYFKRPSKLVLALGVLALGTVLWQMPTIDQDAYNQDAWSRFSNRFQAAATVDTEHDTSIFGRKEAIEEGWSTFLSHWEAGVGPGASRLYNSYTSAHQFNVHQALELGVLGLLASVLLSLGVVWRLTDILIRGPSRMGDGDRFTLIIGPVCYLLFGIVGDMPLNTGVANTWAVLAFGMLGLVEYRSFQSTPPCVGRALPEEIPARVPSGALCAPAQRSPGPQ
jgi:hypothetical protein